MGSFGFAARIRSRNSATVVVVREANRKRFRLRCGCGSFDGRRFELGQIDIQRFARFNAGLIYRTVFSPLRFDASAVEKDARIAHVVEN